LAVTLNLFRENDLVAKNDPELRPSDRRAVFVAMAYMIAYYAIDGYAYELIQDDYAAGMVIVGVGGMSAIVLFLVIHALFKKSVWHMWNLVCVFAIAMTSLSVFPAASGTIALRHFVIGMSIIGAPTVLYMLGSAYKRFASYKLLKQCTVLFAVLLPISTLSNDIVENINPHALPMAALVLVLIIFVGFTLASPITYKLLFSSDWMEDFRKSDMTPLMEKVRELDRFERLGLTPRESEVTELLLEGHTARMIAGRLHIAEGTVNLHTKNLYRKLGINSRMELFARFGVTGKKE
jgi:DNA-binding CsgD family transcriptional regulator